MMDGVMVGLCFDWNGRIEMDGVWLNFSLCHDEIGWTESTEHKTNDEHFK